MNVLDSSPVTRPGLCLLLLQGIVSRRRPSCLFLRLPNAKTVAWQPPVWGRSLGPDLHGFLAIRTQEGNTVCMLILSHSTFWLSVTLNVSSGPARDAGLVVSCLNTSRAKTHSPVARYAQKRLARWCVLNSLSSS